MIPELQGVGLHDPPGPFQHHDSTILCFCEKCTRAEILQDVTPSSIILEFKLVQVDWLYLERGNQKALFSTPHCISHLQYCFHSAAVNLQPKLMLFVSLLAVMRLHNLQ